MKATNTLIFPKTDAELIMARHFLISRNRPYQTVHIPVKDGSGSKVPMIMTEMDLVEKIMFKTCYKVKTDRINVFG